MTSIRLLSSPWVIRLILFPPVLSLTRDLGRAQNLDVRIDEEKCDDFAMTRLARILEAESIDAVLNYVGEGDQTTFAGVDASCLLDATCIIFDSKDGRQPSMLALIIGNVVQDIWINGVSEREPGLCDVFVGVVVNGGSNDPFVL